MSQTESKESLPSQPVFSFGQRCQTSPDAKRSFLSRTLTLASNAGSSPRFRLTRHSVFTPGTQADKMKPLHSNSADLAKQQKTVAKTRSSDFFKKKKEPKIIITPAQEDADKRKSLLDNMPADPAEAKSIKSIKSIQEIASPAVAQPGKSHIPGIFRRKTAKQKEIINTVAQIRHRQSLTRSTSIRALNLETGKLQNVIANQALFGKNQEVSKTFLGALKKVNPKALEKAKKIHLKKRKRKISWYFRKAREFFKRFLQPWNPDSIFIICWKSMILFFIIVQCFFSTYLLAFAPDEQSNSQQTLRGIDLLIDVVYAFDILGNFRTSFYTQGELCTDSREIAKNYLRSTFAIDVLSEISLLGRLSHNSHLEFLVLFDLIRVLHLPRILARLEDYIQFSRVTSSVLQLAKLIMAIIIFAHWWACCIYSIATTEKSSINWMVVAGLDTDDIGEVYVASMYWSIATMATIGYGDIHPTTFKERVVCIVIMISSSVIFGYILNAIGTLLNEMNAFHSESREKMRLLTKYMNDKGLTKDIQSKIRKYLEFYLQKENTMKMEGDNILQLLSINLKEEIIKEVNVKILGDTYMFSSNFRKKLLYIISKDLVEKSLAPDEIIFHHNDQEDCSVYFITSGKVEIFYDKCAVSVQRLSKGENFGFLSFFAEKPRSASAKSVEFSTVFQLKREKFLQRLEEFPSEKETYCMIKDSINLYDNYQYLNLRCYSCQSKRHITLNCPKFHFVWNKQKIITTYLFEQNKFRKDFQRNDHPRFRARGRMEEVQEASMQLQVVQQNELHYQSMIEEQQVQLYSEDEEILDRNIYNLRPILYTAEAVQTKALSLPKLHMNNSIHSLNMIKEFKKREVGDVQSFVMANYDVYYHSLNLDRVKNFEVYYPNHNVSKLCAELERIRVEKMVQMKLGLKGKHISGLLVKSFRFNERRSTRELKDVNSPASLASSGGESARKPHVNRSISKINPSDITFYSSVKKNSIDFAIPFNSESIENTPHNRRGSTFQKERFKNLKIYGVSPSLEEQETLSWNPGKYHSLDRESEEPLIKSLQAHKKDTLPVAKSEFHHQSLYTDESQGLRMSSRQSEEGEDDDEDSKSSEYEEELPMDFSPSLKYKAQKKFNSATNTIQNSSYSDKGFLLSVSKMQTSTPAIDPPFSLNSDLIPSRKIESSNTNMNVNVKVSQFRSGSVSNVIATEFEEEEGYQGFDFSRQMKKLSSKLEENRSLSTFKKKKSRKSIKKKKEEVPTSGTEDLLSMMLRAKISRSNTKERSASEDQGREVSKVIEDYGIRDIVNKVTSRQLD